MIDSLQDYSRERFLRDVGAGVTVGIVALPLAMAFAIASGLKPEAGIWTAILAGAIVAALGGSAVQIAGPAGAFIVIVYGIVERFGLANLLIATSLAGALLILMGALKLGTLVRYVPVSIVIGFTNGIAVLVALSQLKDFLGLSVARMPADFFGQARTLWTHAHSLNPQALALGEACLAGLVIWPRLFGTPARRGLAQDALRVLPSLEALQLHHASRVAAKVPGPIVALISLSVLVHVLQLPVETVGTRFGGIPQGLPVWSLPALSWESASQLLAPTLTIACLGAIESLLCARVADQLRLAVHVPLAVLAGVLMHVAWNMGEWHEFRRLKSHSRHSALLMLGTFVLTVVFDLTVALQVGLVLACVLFVRRMGTLFRVSEVASQDGVRQVALHGALFFGAVAKLDGLLSAVEATPGPLTLRLDLGDLQSLDRSGLEVLEQLQRAAQAKGGRLELLAVQGEPLAVMQRAGFLPAQSSNGVAGPVA